MAEKRTRVRYLNEEEIQALLAESDGDLSDIDDPDFLEKILLKPESEDSAPEEVITPVEIIPDSPNRKGIKRKRNKSVWNKSAFSSENLDDIPKAPTDDSHQGEPLNPTEYFYKYFPESFWDECAKQTNIYAYLKKGDRFKKTDATGIKIFSGMHIIMGIMQLPQVRLYWSKCCDMPMITKNMTRDRFFELRNTLHFVDKSFINDEQKKDKLHLVRPIINCFRDCCLTLPRTKCLSIDEQMIPFSGRCAMRQYVPSKPNPVGLKNFINAAQDGLVLDFLIYTGADTVSTNDKISYGLGGAVVKHLVATVPTTSVTHLFTDRYFTGIPILDYLRIRNISLTGTIMRNRTDGAADNFPQDRDMERGSSTFRTRADGKACLVKWKDNKSALMLSNAFGISPEGTCKRWCKEENKKIDVQQPAVVKAYNTYMGGVDLMDRYIAYYRISTRTKKWTMRVFAHFLDMATCNSWILYTRHCKQSQVRRKDYLQLLQFKLAIAESLVNKEISKEECNSDRKIAQKVVPLPGTDVRYDKVGHFPEHVKLQNQMKCRNPGCKELGRLRFFATGTDKENRTGNCPIMPVKSMKKEVRGTYQFAFDKHNEITIDGWNDNAVMTVATSFETVEPINLAMSYSKAEKNIFKLHNQIS
ncbi:piggyBac transposable element-derived protein 2-like [Uloborus diversus]|uniref:piggyBac transposable element-derived protein 2-like n=1 Tax=Uloborus diversus TaxID=327109 RepID=UPI002409C37E|nr:piggyBac transposable element-derived protein 2-like [Uloborus diversus]